jgi:hypothetical protein
MTLEPWAKAQVERLIAPLGNRWAHVQAVARQAGRVAVVLSAEDGDVLVAAAFLHDVGYAPSLNRLGFHPVDGAQFLRAPGQERLACLVAHHSGARFEAEERGLVDELAAFPVEEGPVMDALTFADMTTGPAGQPMNLDQRVDESCAATRRMTPFIERSFGLGRSSRQRSNGPGIGWTARPLSRCRARCVAPDSGRSAAASTDGHSGCPAVRAQRTRLHWSRCWWRAARQASWW